MSEITGGKEKKVHHPAPVCNCVCPFSAADTFAHFLSASQNKLWELKEGVVCAILAVAQKHSHDMICGGFKRVLHYFKAQAMEESFSCKVSRGIPFPLEGLGQIVWTSCDQVPLLVAACRDSSTQFWGWGWGGARPRPFCLPESADGFRRVRKLGQMVSFVSRGGSTSQPSSLVEAVICAVGLRFPDLRIVSEPFFAAGTCKDALTPGTSCSPLFLPPWKPLLSPLLC